MAIDGQRFGPGGFMALAAGTVIDRYRIDSVIAAGGFGITYFGHHTTLGNPLAIKEHFPRQLAYREGTSSEIRPTDPDTYAWALDRFIQEGQTLARCRHPGVVSVADVFAANGTAYMVLGYEQGRSFKTWLDMLGRRPTQQELDGILKPLLDALAYVHAQGLLHRDIAPDNIMIRDDGSPCLIDFGAARQAVAERSAMMSAIVKTGFSPPEQYTRSGRAQGPWSDIYALGATLYRAIGGGTPTEATDRQIEDDLEPIGTRVASGAYRPAFLSAIDHALRLPPAERPRSIAEWREALFAEPEAVRPPEIPQRAIPIKESAQHREAMFEALRPMPVASGATARVNDERPPPRSALYWMVPLLVLTGVVAWYALGSNKDNWSWKQEPVRTSPAVTAPPAPSHQQVAFLAGLMRDAVSRCWNVTPIAGGLESPNVRVEVRLNRNGSLAEPPKVTGSSPAFQATADDAIRAIIACAPYKLPADMYESWRHMVLNFDLRAMGVTPAPPVAAKPKIAPSPEAVLDDTLLRSSKWRALKNEFPAWYQERVRETVLLKSEGKSEQQIAEQLANQSVALRRRHVSDVLAASPQTLRGIARAFLDSLQVVAKHSTDACYGFISSGETHPKILELLQSPGYGPELLRVSASISTAIAEGRKTPAKHASPTRQDYDLLAAQLAKSGWSPQDLQLFSDARSLARASPERVCKMVQDWFTAQLAISDENAQTRLLIEALKPVISG